MAKFLDDLGLRALWAKAKELLGEKLDRGGGHYSGESLLLVNDGGDCIGLDMDGVNIRGSVRIDPDSGIVTIGTLDTSSGIDFSGVAVPGKDSGMPVMLCGDVLVGGDLGGAAIGGSLTVPAPTGAGHAAPKKYVDDKLAEAGDMQASVYDPQGRGEDVFAAIDRKSAYQQAVAAGYAGTEAEFYAALVSLKDGPFLPTKGGEILGPLTVDASGWERGKYAGLDLSSADGMIGLTASDDQLALNVTPWATTGFAVYLNKGASEVYTEIPDPEADPNIANKRYVDAQIQTRADKAHTHTAADVGALPADVSDITDISTISGPEGSVMVELSGDLSVSIDGADKVVVLPDETVVYQPLHMSNKQITGVKAPTAATDAANKEYVDSKALVFTGKTVAITAWTADTAYSAQGYGWRAAVACAGVTASHRPDVAFSCADAVSGNFAPVADSYAGGVYIYCKTKPTATVTIPSIVCIKGV